MQDPTDSTPPRRAADEEYVEPLDTDVMVHETPAPPATGPRDTMGRFQPGFSGNPRGRQKTGFALTELIRKRLDLDQLFDIAWSLARGVVPRAPIDVTAGAQVTFEPMVVKPRERLAALNFLAQYGGFKPPDRFEVTSPEARAVDFGRLAPEELGTFERMLAKAAGEPEPEGTP